MSSSTILENCAICLSEISTDLHETECGHIFHLECIQDWVNSGPNKKCPLCRGETGLQRENIENQQSDYNDFNDGMNPFINDSDEEINVVYDRLGFSRSGYDRRGYERLPNEIPDQFNIRGFDADEYAFERGPRGYDRGGYDIDGYDRGGFNRFNLDRSGYQRLPNEIPDQFNIRCFDVDGYNRGGFDSYGFDRNHLDHNGYARLEYEQDFSTRGYNLYGYDRGGFDRDGYNSDGFNIDHINRNGTQYDDNGFNIDHIHRNGTQYDDDGYNYLRIDSEGIDEMGFDAITHINIETGTLYSHNGFDYQYTSIDGITVNQYFYNDF